MKKAWRNWRSSRKTKQKAVLNEAELAEYAEIFQLTKAGKIGRPFGCLSDALFDSETGYFIAAYSNGIIQWNVSSFAPNPSFEPICEWDLRGIVAKDCDDNVNSVAFNGKISCLQLVKDPKPALFCLLDDSYIVRVSLSDAMNKFSTFTMTSSSNFTWTVVPGGRATFIKAIDGLWVWIGNDSGSVVVFDWEAKEKLGSYSLDYEEGGSSIFKENKSVYRIEMPNPFSLLAVYENGCASLSYLGKNEEVSCEYFCSDNPMDLLVACSAIAHDCWTTASQTGIVRLWNASSKDPLVLMKCLRVMDLELYGQLDESDKSSLRLLILGQVDDVLTGVSLVNLSAQGGNRNSKILSNQFFAMDDPLLSRVFQFNSNVFWSIGKHTDSLCYIVSLNEQISSGEESSWSHGSFSKTISRFFCGGEDKLVLASDKTITVFDGRGLQWEKVFTHTVESVLLAMHSDQESKLLLYLTSSHLGVISHDDNEDKYSVREYDISPAINIELPRLLYFPSFEMVLIAVREGLYLSDFHEDPSFFRRMKFVDKNLGKDGQAIITEVSSSIWFVGSLDCSLVVQMDGGTCFMLNVMEGLGFEQEYCFHLNEPIIAVDRTDPESSEDFLFCSKDSISKYSSKKKKCSAIVKFSKQIEDATILSLDIAQFLLTYQNQKIDVYHLDSGHLVKSFAIWDSVETFVLESSGSFVAKTKFGELILWFAVNNSLTSERRVTISVPQNLSPTANADKGKKTSKSIFGWLGLGSTVNNMEWSQLFVKNARLSRSNSRAKINPSSSSSSKAEKIVDSTFQETMNGLNERGERLENLAKKTGEMSSQAEDFLSLAKQINKKEQNRWF